MARLILHIGAHKTGTSYLQRVFFRNRKLLAQHGIHYPDLGPNPAHHILSAPWIDIPEIPASHYGKGGPDGLWQRFVDSHADLPGTVFLSGEPFSRGAPQKVDMPDLARRLSRFEDVRVVYTVRGQPELVQSIWLQVAKTVSPPPFRAFLRGAMQIRMGSGLWLDHGDVLDHVLTGFAPEQVTLLDYDTIRRGPGGVTQAFLDLIGSDLTADALTPVDAAQSNISPDPLATWIATRISAPHRAPPELIRQVGTALAIPEGRRSSAFTRDEYAALLDLYRPLNEALVRRVSATQPDFAFATPDAPPDLIWRDMVGMAGWAHIARTLYQAR